MQTFCTVRSQDAHVRVLDSSAHTLQHGLQKMLYAADRMAGDAL